MRFFSGLAGCFEGDSMARLARVDVFAPDEVAIVHVMNRTVRRCFLLGNDPLTGKNYDHRKEWLEKELRRLAAQFGIDLLCHAIMSNHFHLVLRSRPDVVAIWDDTEVACRWLRLCPLRKDDQGRAIEPSEFELNTIRNNPARLAAVRSRLSDISWWMRLLSQHIAQRANRDDQEVGKFWQARYRAVRLLDETAVLACAAYVDLNPIRAAICKTLEGSDYTSVQKRMVSIAAVHGTDETAGPANLGTADADSKRVEGVEGNGPDTANGVEVAASRLADGFLSPLEIDERRDAAGPCSHAGGARASDKGFLPMTTGAYIELLDWTARQIRSDKRGSTPTTMQPIFERLGINREVWCGLVKNFGRLFYAVAGQPEQIDSRRSRDGQHRYKTKRETRELLAV
jgi:hypothetical protein